MDTTVKVDKAFVKRLLNNTKRKGIKELLNWLEFETDFFTAPASSKYHLNIEEGLIYHSVSVYALLIEEVKQHGIVVSTGTSLAIIGLLHDVCKINTYIPLEGGGYEKKKHDGHSVRSIEILERFITLTDEERIAIRHHMGAYEDKETAKNINSVFSNNKLAFITHIADYKAAYLL